jgi:malate synthase
MSQYINKNGLQVSTILDQLLNDEILPGLSVNADAIWAGFSQLVQDLAPENKALLAKREDLQSQIDAWHNANPNGLNTDAYKTFLKEIGYLVEEGEKFSVTTENVDDEIARIAGPQLVVPVNNARFSLNAANARWGSLYDALYGTDAIAEDEGYERSGGFNERRGSRVIATAASFLDKAMPLENNISHSDVTEYQLTQGDTVALTMTLSNGQTATLANTEQFVAYTGELAAPQVLLFSNNDLHIELHINRDHPIGKMSPSGVSDVVIESAISTIQDCEDSVAAVDAEDKSVAYRNWLGLMKGDLAETFEKNGKTLTHTTL